VQDSPDCWWQSPRRDRPETHTRATDGDGGPTGNAAPRDTSCFLCTFSGRSSSSIPADCPGDSGGASLWLHELGYALRSQVSGARIRNSTFPKSRAFRSPRHSSKLAPSRSALAESPGPSDGGANSIATGTECRDGNEFPALEELRLHLNRIADRLICLGVALSVIDHHDGDQASAALQPQSEALARESLPEEE
jgi:hypothetical protein